MHHQDKSMNNMMQEFFIFKLSFKLTLLRKNNGRFLEMMMLKRESEGVLC